MADKFNPNKYGKLWSTVDCELMQGTKAKIPTGDANQPLIGTFLIGGKRFELTYSETNRVIETMLDMQNVYKKAQRLGMLDQGTGTWRG
mgnify:FL=1|tara:strand:- start:17833 stop:18099 length:267 start_codon:yes stop_codon:yes gene_type:complete